MAEVKFPAYRSYVSSRRDANDAMMALLAGSRLAAHSLQLTEGSTHLLADIFPAVDHIERFNLRTDSARRLLLEADGHLGAVSVPYALAVHEAFVMSSIELLRVHGVQIAKIGHSKQTKAWNMHEVLFGSTGSALPAVSLEQYHVLREMRNCQIHAGGYVSDQLKIAVANMSIEAVAEWTRTTRRSPSDILGAPRIAFTAGDIFTSFAVTKRLGRDVNTSLQAALTPDAWATIVVSDFSTATKKARNSSTWLRSLLGYARQYYGELALPDATLESVAVRLGVYSRPG